MPSEFNRDEYFHQVQITAIMVEGIESSVKQLTGETWEIEWTDDFWFRLVDHTDGKDEPYPGWFVNLDGAVARLQKMFPTKDIRLLTT